MPAPPSAEAIQRAATSVELGLALVCLAFALISEASRVLEDPFNLYYNGLPLNNLWTKIKVAHTLPSGVTFAAATSWTLTERADGATLNGPNGELSMELIEVRGAESLQDAIDQALAARSPGPG